MWFPSVWFSDVDDRNIINDELQQKQKRVKLAFSAFNPTFSEAAGINGYQRISLEATIAKVVSFCQNQRIMPEISGIIR